MLSFSELKMKKPDIVKLHQLRALVSFGFEDDDYYLECIDIDGTPVGGENRALHCDSSRDLAIAIKALRHLLPVSRVEKMENGE